MPRSSDLFLGGIDALAGGIQSAHNYYRKDLEARDDRAKQNAMADPLIQDAIERIMNGEHPDDVANDHLAREYHRQQPSVSQTRQPSPGPWTVGYDNGPDQGPMIPYSEPVRGGRLSSGPQLDTSSLAIGRDPGIQNKDVPDLMKLSGMLQAERYRDANLDLGYGRLGLGYDKLDAQMQKDAGLQELRDAQAALTRARLAGMPMQEELAKQRIAIAQAKLGQQERALALQGDRLNLSETKEYMKGAGNTIQTISQLDQLINEAKNTPGLQIPESDFYARRRAEVASELPIAGKALGKYMNVKADEALTPEQRTFKRQKLQSLVSYIHENYGTQLTSGEQQWINAIQGDQVSWVDAMAGLEAMSASLKSRANLYGQAYPNAAARIQAPANPLPQIIQGGTRRKSFDSLPLEERKAYGVNNQQELDEMYRRGGWGGDSLEQLNYGYTPGP